jgi:hypothetical protein
VLFHPEPGRHTALAVHPVPEGDGFQVAAQVIAPGVVDALKVLGAAAGVVEADQGSAMRTAVFERGNLSLAIADHHDRHLPDNCRAPVAGIGDLVFKAQKIPHRALENSFLLGVEEGPIAVDPKRHPCNVAAPADWCRNLRMVQNRVGHRASPFVADRHI